MKEIDFLPKWYKSTRQRQLSLRRQYIAVGCIFVMMVAWNFQTAHSVSKVAAQVAQDESKVKDAERKSNCFGEVKNKTTELQEKVDILEGIDSRINVADVLAEMSFLVDEKIVLNEVDFKAERFVTKGKGGAGNRSAVRAANVGGRFFGSGIRQGLSFGKVRFKVMITGIAADAGDVAALICKLEDSPYFCQVYPEFSRNTKVREQFLFENEKSQASEFKISCYLANYSELEL